MNEKWILISLEQGHYLGLDGVFDTKEEAVEYVEEELGYVKATEEFFGYYGEVDYVSQEGAKWRIAIQKAEMNPKATGIWSTKPIEIYKK